MEVTYVFFPTPGRRGVLVRWDRNPLRSSLLPLVARVRLVQSVARAQRRVRRLRRRVRILRRVRRAWRRYERIRREIAALPAALQAQAWADAFPNAD